MKILYHHRIASKDGQFVHVEELTNALKEQGHEIYIVSPGFTEDTDFGNDGGFVTRLKRILPKAIYELLELSYSLLISIKLARAIKSFQPDIIYERYNLYQPIGVIISKIFKIPILLEVNAPLADERAKYSGLSLIWLAKKVENFTWKSADKVLPVTKVLADMIIASGVSAERVSVIHNGINDNLLSTTLCKNDIHKKDSIIIGFVGFINKWHRIDLAINAIADFPGKNIKLICVGDGDIKDDLEKLADSLSIKDNVIFTGLKTREEVFNIIKTFDIALQPSVTPYASPLKLFEYMSSGSLIIAPRTNNICEVLDDENAVLFTPDDFNDFSKKLHFAIDNIDNLQNIRLNARDTILNDGYTWQNNARNVVELAKSLL